ncbi:Ras-related protein Rab-7a [Hypsizygus marmoreus]|uniref:Ras-related protein Rab-7a n=1 Tax=Hypsizygus marmoreus TaxID=39966 RepID=A0A369KBZ3_HYPMA|nr:Ras-related protein Rab-7a [Hypsizygus marmoreus]
MPTVKLVVIGASGVGKTSLRGQYISGRFSNGYRATIGADFITKILPHPGTPGESVTLQIWDTAGQERFSSLSTAFFRGADAAVLMFDVNTPETMAALTKWWAEFREKAPLADDDVREFCCVVVGNKMDLVGSGKGGEEGPVREDEARQFLAGLVPASSRSPSPISALDLPTPTAEYEDDPLASSQVTMRPALPFPNIASPSSSTPSPPPPALQIRSNSIAIIPNQRNVSSPSLSSHSPKHHLSKSRSRSSSHFYGGTMTTTHTTLTIYHTPSSSLFDVYHSARSSPEPWSTSSSPSARSSMRGRRMTARSTASTSTGSAVTITPSLFARENGTSTDTEVTTPESEPFSSSLALPPPPERGPKLFFASAKTGEGVSDVFEYVVQRVIRRWEYDELVESRRMHIREASAAETIRLGLESGKRRTEGRGLGSCCGS